MSSTVGRVVYILKDQFDEIRGVYSDKAGAQQHADRDEAQMNDDNYMRLMIEAWEVDVPWGEIDEPAAGLR